VRARCAEVIVVRPLFSADELGGSFTDDELRYASNRIAATIAARYETNTIVWPDQLEELRQCPAKYVSAVLISYHREPAARGQWYGCLSMELRFYKGPTGPDQPEAVRRLKFEIIGRRHWGDSTPFSNAVARLCETIQYHLWLPKTGWHLWEPK